MSNLARSQSDWSTLEDISIQSLRTIYKRLPLNEIELREVIRNYLSAIVGTGGFLTNLESNDSLKYEDGLAKLFDYLRSRPTNFSVVERTLQAGLEIGLLSRDPITADRNKIASHLREVARPDISVTICLQILNESRLNYYSRTILCGAYCDLDQLDDAIDSAEVALKFSSGAAITYALNALVRAHTLKFKKNGDFSEIQKALTYGRQSINLHLDTYSANAFVAAAIASLDEKEIEHAKEVLARSEPQMLNFEIDALLRRYKVVQQKERRAEVVEVIDESTDNIFVGGFDTLYDLVRRDEGFYPEVLDLRGMPQRFSQDGWFLQGLSKVPCPTCEVVALHAYRKHFNRYEKDMHYWALVCDHCKTATDSIDYDKKVFTFISGDLEDNFPVTELCVVCLTI